MTSIVETRRAILDALTLLRGRDEPEDLLVLAKRIAALSDDAPLESDLDALLDNALPVNPVVISLGEVVSKLDAAAEEQKWAEGTQPFSAKRREVVCRSLGLPPKSIAELARLRPVMHLKRPTVISEEFTRWYTRTRATEREFYWPCYRDYLRNKRNWTEVDLRSLDLASDEVMERLADPLAPRPRRGLVVGHVQSGKTANFTGVIAKAIDQGYRLVIVLAGMQEPLRRQTQRRLDMELLGRPNILLDLTELQAAGTPQGEYQDDPMWDEDMFSNLQGSKPRPEILRLTSRSFDFNKFSASSLRFKAPDDHVPLYDESRLFSTQARLAVVKKNKDVLGHW